MSKLEKPKPWYFWKKKFEKYVKNAKNRFGNLEFPFLTQAIYC